MNIYLDIDGVILANDKQPALYANEFIRYLVDNHDVYWLTTHCRSLADDPVGNLLIRFFERSTVEYLYRIKPTRWDMMKTEGIDFSQPFLWFDDDLFEEEKRVLEEYDALSSHVMINLSQDPTQLKTLLADRF